MKQNIDCMKSVLKVLEDELTIHHIENDFYVTPIKIARIVRVMSEKQPEFDCDEIAYSVLQLIARKYIATTEMSIIPSGDIRRISFGSVLYITPEGHDFLSSR